MRVRDLAVDDRPRERALRRGVEVLSDRELLALLLGSGARDVDAIELAGQLIARQGGLRQLARAAPQELVGLLGIGPAKATRISAAFQLARRAFSDEYPTNRIAATADLAAQAAPLLRGLDRERVVVVACDKAGTVLRTAVLTEGATDRSLIPVPDVLRIVLAAGGTAFGVAHNHPSGDAAPSAADIRATVRLASAAATVGLRFLDHVVLTDSSWRRVTADQ